MFLPGSGIKEKTQQFCSALYCKGLGLAFGCETIRCVMIAPFVRLKGTGAVYGNNMSDQVAGG